MILLEKADRSPAHLLGSCIGRHDDDDVAKIGLAPIVVGQRTVVHDLQQQIEHLRMRLLDFVQQQHTVRILGDRLGHQPALVEADVPGRCTDQPRYRVPLHVFGHVEADQFDAETMCELARHFGLADARRTGKEE